MLSKLQLISNWILVITAICGTYFLLQELKELRKQNNSLQKQSEILERSLKQTYRPVGVVKHNFENPQKIGLIFRERDEVNKFSFVMFPKIKNLGQGILSYLGSMSYLSKESISFRDSLLNGVIEGVKFDGMYPYARRTPLLTGDIFQSTVMWENIPFEKNYYLYILFLY